MPICSSFPSEFPAATPLASAPGNTGTCVMPGAAEAARARPLSGGLWALLGWLRRDERSSSESLSSAGSDRTAASFAFLPPPRPRPRAGSPSPAPAPATDSYKKRVRDRNLRRQYDRDLTIHRKYGLFRGDGGYDAFSLPFARRSLDVPGAWQDRDRRATSECCQRPAAHVPGKRRAPPPPAIARSVRAASAAPYASLTRRQTRKRPAPQPPAKSANNETFQTIEKQSINITVQMNSKSERDKRPKSSSDVSMGCKSEKYIKKDTKSGQEKNFLKQIFDSKKRHSTVISAPGKILPNISELDREAAEIIESCKLKPLEQNNNSTDFGALSQKDMWFCTRCLRKYSSKIVTCPQCLPEQRRLANVFAKEDLHQAPKASNSSTQTEKQSRPQASTSRISGIGDDEKQKLKEMLKEMKNSLPKRQKHESCDIININEKKNITDPDLNEENLKEMETPTLKIGSTVLNEYKIPQGAQSTSSTETSVIKNIETVLNERLLPNNIKQVPVNENVVITQHVVVMAPHSVNASIQNDQSSIAGESISSQPSSSKQVNNVMHKTILPEVMQLKNGDNKEISKISSFEKHNLNTPLKISSLLNPVYIPKSNISEIQSQRSLFFSQAPKNLSSPTKIEFRSIPVKTVVNEKPLANPNLISVSATTSHSQSVSSNTKASITNQTQSKYETKKQSYEKQHSSTTEEKNITRSPIKPIVHNINTSKPNELSSTENKNPSSNSNVSSNKQKISNSNMVRLSAEQHSRRRELVNQLEQSIAKGDERSAADAAVKLAQLRLSCSVLSFSSQIVGESSKTTLPTVAEENLSNEGAKTKTPIKQSSKVDTAVQSLAAVGLKKEKKEESSFNNKEKGVYSKVEMKKSVTLSSKGTEKSPHSDNKDEKIAKSELSAGTELPSSVEPSTSKQLTNDNGNNFISIQIWVEDREATRGPVSLRVPRCAALAELRRRAEAALGLPARLQRWIVGRALCADDAAPLAALAGPDLAAPFYLCLVESETNSRTLPRSRVASESDNALGKAEEQNQKAGDVYSELVQLEQRPLVPNAETFECGVCMEEYGSGRGAVLHECVHTFCRGCLSDLVRHCEEPAVSCPAMGCPGVLQEREIRALVSDAEYERWLARGLATAESGTRNAFHCRTRDCTGWALCEPGVQRFPCPVCKRTNCVPCQAFHEGETCEQYRAKLQEATKNLDADQTDDGTRVLLDALIAKGEALQCPECSAIITKKWGCDWVKCSACKTEICWVTRGRRWGPAGRGDSSGGCRCGLDGKRCHPSCGYCH